MYQISSCIVNNDNCAPYMYRFLYAVVGMEAFHNVDVGDSVLSYSAYECGLGFQDFK